MSTISVKCTNPIELEKLCLLKSKIAEIELLFQMTENDYWKLISLLFVSEKCLKEITNFLAFNYPITIQEYMLSVNCEKKFIENFKKLSQNHNQMNFFVSKM